LVNRNAKGAEKIRDLPGQLLSQTGEGTTRVGHNFKGVKKGGVLQKKKKGKEVAKNPPYSINTD